MNAGRREANGSPREAAINTIRRLENAVDEPWPVRGPWSRARKMSIVFPLVNELRTMLERRQMQIGHVLEVRTSRKRAREGEGDE